MALEERQLLALAGETGFARGEEYVRYVHGLRVDGSHARASIQARNVYLVELAWSGKDLQGSCTCPHHARGFFCKHQVALGLAVLDRAADRHASPEAAPVSAYLAGLDAAALRELVVELGEQDPVVRRALELRAAVATGSQESVAEDLLGLVREALRTRGYVDYRRSFDVAQDAHQLLDVLEDALDRGAVDAALPALRKAVTRLRTVILNADDSNGDIGDACQRSADLYARACREGSPDPVKLARWLVKFRDESPGWPETTLDDFVSAFDEKALAAYRKAVAALEQRDRAVDHLHRFELDRMLLELADHDGDLDRAIDLLASGEYPQYGAIVERLREAGREDEVTAWIDRAVAEGRVSASMGPTKDYWLAVDDVVTTYLALGRDDDAIGEVRRQLSCRPAAAPFFALVDLATRLGREEPERDWALGVLRADAQGYARASVLIEIALAEGDLDAAWSAADEFGVGPHWEQLADASAAERPLDAARLHRAFVEDRLQIAQTERYPGIARSLTTMRDLHACAGDLPSFQEYLADLRATYVRRTSLMAELGRVGL